MALKSASDSDLLSSFKEIDSENVPMVRDDGADSFKAAFGFPARLPNKRFGRELQRRQGDRWAGDRSIALDHIGTDTFAEMRSAELAQIAGAEYLAELYGVGPRSASRTSPNNRACGSSIPTVRRISAPRPTSISMRSARGYTAGIRAATTLVVRAWYSSIPGAPMGACERKSRLTLILSRLTLIVVSQFAGRVHARGPWPGCDRIPDAETAKKVRVHVGSVGGTPSNYEVLKLGATVARLQRGKPSDPAEETDPELSNDTLLRQIVPPTKGEGPIAASDILPHEHPMRAVAGAEAALVKGLLNTFEATMTVPKFRPVRSSATA